MPFQPQGFDVNQQYTPFSSQTVARRVRLAHAYAPTEDPIQTSLYFNLARGSQLMGDDAYLDQVGKLAGLKHASNIAGRMKSISQGDGDQWDKAVKQWKGMTSTQKSVLRMLGVPDFEAIQERRDASGGGGGGILGTVANIAAAPFETAYGGAAAVGKGALFALNQPWSGLQRLYRFGATDLGTANPFALLPSLVSHPGDIAREMSVNPFAKDRIAEAFHNAFGDNGDRAVHIDAKDKALQLLHGDDNDLETALDFLENPNLYDLAEQRAKSIVGIKGNEDLVSNPDYVNAFQNQLQKLSRPRFQKAVAALAAGKVSIGDDTARSFGLSPTDKIPGVGLSAFSVVSLTSEIAVSFAFDPFIIAGKLYHGTQLARGIRLQNLAVDAEELKAASAAREFSDIGKVVTDGQARQAYLASLNAMPVDGRKKFLVAVNDAFQLTPEGKYNPLALAALREMFPRARQLLPTLIKIDQDYRHVPPALRALGRPSVAAAAVSDAGQVGEDAGTILTTLNKMDDVRAAAQGQTVVTGSGHAGFDSFDSMTRLNQEQDLITGLNAGRAASYTKQTWAWPEMTKAGAQWINTKMAAEHGFEWLSGRPENFQSWLKSLETVDDAALKPSQAIIGTKRIAANIAQKFGDLATSLTQHIPQEAVISLHAADAGERWMQFLRLGLGKDESLELYGKFMGAVNDAGKRAIIREGMKRVMTNYGVDGKTVDEWVQSIAGRSQIYTNDSAYNTIRQGVDEVPSALWEHQLADDLIAIPSFRNLSSAMARHGMAKTAHLVNSGVADTLMGGVWKPLVLLRLGFIPRAAGEEVLSWVARSGLLQPMQHWLVVPFHRSKLEAEALNVPQLDEWSVAAPFRLIARAQRKLFHYDHLDEARQMYKLRELRTAAASSTEKAKEWEKAVLEGAQERLDSAAYYMGVPYKKSLARNKPLFYFNPEDVSFAKMLEGGMRKMTDRWLDPYVAQAIRLQTRDPAHVNRYMSMVTGSDSFQWENELEWKNQRGNIELGDPNRQGKMIKFVVDRTHNRGYTADDPLFHMMLSGKMNAMSREFATRPAVASLMAVIHDPTARSIGAQLGQDGYGVVRQVRSAYERLDGATRSVLDDLMYVDPEAGEVAAAVHRTWEDQTIATVAKRIADNPDLTIEQHQALKTVLERWHDLDNHERAAMFFDRRVLLHDLETRNARAKALAGKTLDPLSPTYADEVKARDLAAQHLTIPDTGPDVQAAQEAAQARLRAGEQNPDAYPGFRLSGAGWDNAERTGTSGSYYLDWERAPGIEEPGQRLGVAGRLFSDADEAGITLTGEVDMSVRAQEMGYSNPERLLRVYKRWGFEEVGRRPSEGIIELRRTPKVATRSATWDELHTVVGNEPMRKRLELIDRAEKGDADAGEQLLEEMLHVSARSTRTDAGMFDRMHQTRGGTPMAKPVPDGFTRVWVPMVNEDAARRVATRLARSGNPEDQVLLATYLRQRGISTGDLGAAAATRDAPVNLVPFGYWAHTDSRRAAEVAQKLAGEGPHTVASIDVKTSHLAGSRLQGSAEGEYAALHQDWFGPETLNIAPDSEALAAVRGPLDKPAEYQARRVLENLRGNTEGELLTKARGALERSTNPEAPVPGHLEAIAGVLGHPRDPEAELVMAEIWRRAEESGDPAAYIERLSNLQPQAELVGRGGAVRVVSTAETPENLAPRLKSYITNSKESAKTSQEALDAALAEHVGVGASEDEVLHDLVKARKQDIINLFRSPGKDNTPFYELGRSVAHGTWDPRVSYGTMRRPDHIFGASYVQYNPNLFKDFVRWGFDRVISPSIDAIVRRPVYTENFAKALRDAERTLVPILRDPEKVAQVTEVLNKLGYEGDTKTFFRDIDPLFRFARDSGIDIRTAKDLEFAGKRFIASRTASIHNDLPFGVRRSETERILEQGGITLEDYNAQLHFLTKFNDYYPEGLGLEKAVERGMASQEVEESDRLTQLISDWWNNEDNVQTTMTRAAGERAFNDTVPYIDDHRIRAQFADQIRNLVPFYFAEEQFLKRWVRTIAMAPEGIRRLQLIKMGLSTSGVITKDQYGQDQFTYPLSAELNDVLGHVAEKITGHPATLPMLVPLTGEVKYSLPGFDRLGVPSTGPLVSIPLTEMANRFPELKNVEYKILSERSAGRGIADALIPSSVKRFYDAAVAKPETSQEMAATMMSVIQYMEAAGLTPPDGASTHAQEVYLERVENWTRTMMITRAITGFAGPAAPSTNVPGKEMSKTFRDLLHKLPIGEAVTTFIRDNPDSNAYTVFQSTTPSRASVSPTEKTLKWIESNQGLLSQFPMGAPWIIPQDEKGTYSAKAYNQQLSFGIRQRRMPADYYRELKFAAAAPLFFQTRDAYNAKIEVLRGVNSRSKVDLAGVSKHIAQLEQEFGDWKSAFLNQHPMFAEELASPTARQRRTQIFEDLRSMAEDKSIPKKTMPEDVRFIVDTYSGFRDQMDMLRYQTGSTAARQRQTLRVQVLNFLDSYTKRHPQARALYLRVMQPELDVDAENLVGVS